MQSVDEGVTGYIRKMVDYGVYSREDMLIHVDQYVESIFPTDQLPLRNNRRFYPLDQHIKKHIALSIRRMM